jgi:hypothetical protein
LVKVRMATLRAVRGHLARAAGLTRNEISSFSRALRDAGLIPQGSPGRGGSKETPEGAAWLILALLCGREAKRAVERAKMVGEFRHLCFPDDPDLKFIAVLTQILGQGSGAAAVFPCVMVADRLAGFVYSGPDPVEVYFSMTPTIESDRGDLCHMTEISPAVLEEVAALLGSGSEQRERRHGIGRAAATTEAEAGA